LQQGRAQPVNEAVQQRLDEAWTLKKEFFAVVNSDPARAAAISARLGAIAAAGDQPEVAALAAWTEGITLAADGRLEEALARLDQAAGGFAALGRDAVAAETQVAKVMALAMLGRQDEAAEVAARARATFIRCGDIRSAGKIELNLGSILLRADRYAEAAQMYRQAAVRFARLGDNEHSIMADIGLADALTSQYALDEAMLIYERARARARVHALPVLSALVEGSVGLLELHRGRLDAALRALEASRRGFEELRLPQRLAVAERNLADAYLEVNLLPEAIALYDRALVTFASLGMPIERAWAYLQRGRALALQGSPEAARASLAEAVTLFRSQDNAVGVALAELWDAELSLSLGDITAARAGGERASPPLAAAGLVGWQLLAEVVVGSALAAGGDLVAAQARLESALALAGVHRLQSVAAACYSGLGRVAEFGRDLDGARDCYEEAARLFEARRTALPGDEFRTAFAADRSAPYEAMVRVGAARGASATQLLALMERARSRSLLEQFGRPATPHGDADLELGRLRAQLNRVHHQMMRALEDEADPAPLQQQARAIEAELLEAARRARLHEAAGPQVAVSTFDPARLQAALGDDEALVEYFLTDERLLAVVVTRDELRLVRAAAAGEVQRGVERLRFQIDALRHGSRQLRSHLPLLQRRAQAHLRELDALLLAPLGLDASLRRLTVIPHKSLHYVPFAALGDREPLLARCEVSVAPSAAVLLRALAQPAPRWARALAVGAAVEQLPHVDGEVRAVAACFVQATILLGQQASTANVRALAADADVLHLACHGHFRADSPYFSALHLADGTLTVRDVQELPLRASLVTLSACETAVSHLAPGEELVGLTRGFMQAGVPAVLASLWAVDDESTAALMESFYRRLQSGQRPAAALRGAQLSLADGAHPYYWAPFVLSGRG
jgi:CHAT domain-containing protein